MSFTDERSVEAADGSKIRPESEWVGWNSLTRIVFRFLFVYFGLVFLTQPPVVNVFLGWLANWEWRGPGLQVRLMNPLVGWVGHTVFGVDAGWIVGGTADQGFAWVLTFFLLVLAAVATIVWTVLDRRRREYRRLAGWSLLVLRWCLGGQLLYFGFSKVIPMQMPRPALATLLTPYGDMTPMVVLWNQVGLSQPYEILLGAAEVLAGLMLFIPRIAILGAMLALVDMSLVFIQNVAFDVPVRLWAAHLLLVSLVLLAPETKRLVDVLVLDRPSGRSTAPVPFRMPRSRRVAALAQLALAVWIGAGLVHFDWPYWRQHGSDRPEPPLHGIWTVQQFTRDGQDVPPLLTDPNRWQRIVVDDPGVLDYQRMDGTLVPALLHVDVRTHRLDLRTAPVGTHPAAPQRQPESVGTFTFVLSSPDDLRLDGELDGHPVTVTLRRFDENSFPQRSQGFHWVQGHAAR